MRRIFVYTKHCMLYLCRQFVLMNLKTVNLRQTVYYIITFQIVGKSLEKYLSESVILVIFARYHAIVQLVSVYSK